MIAASSGDVSDMAFGGTDKLFDAVFYGHPEIMKYLLQLKPMLYD
jgi:hypothetical protein